MTLNDVEGHSPRSFPVRRPFQVQSVEHLCSILPDFNWQRLRGPSVAVGLLVWRLFGLSSKFFDLLLLRDALQAYSDYSLLGASSVFAKAQFSCFSELFSRRSSHKILINTSLACTRVDYLSRAHFRAPHEQFECRLWLSKSGARLQLSRIRDKPFRSGIQSTASPVCICMIQIHTGLAVLSGPLQWMKRSRVDLESRLVDKRPSNLSKDRIAAASCHPLRWRVDTGRRSVRNALIRR